jgi:hypothetical protein
VTQPRPSLGPLGELGPADVLAAIRTVRDGLVVDLSIPLDPAVLPPADPRFTTPLERRDAVDPGVRDEDVESPEPLDGRVDEALGVDGLRDVAGHGQHALPGTDRLGGRAQDVGSPGHDGDVRALPDEQLGDAAPDPGRTAGDRRGLPGESTCAGHDRPASRSPAALRPHRLPPYTLPSDDGRAPRFRLRA